MFKTLLIVTFKNMFFVMSVSGTVVFIFYMLLYPLSRRYFSLKWRYRILKLAMMFFLVPFPLCKYYVWGFFYDHLSWIREIASQYESSEINTDYIIVANRDSILLSPKVQSVYLTVLVIVLISSFLLWKQITQYRKMKQICFIDLRESAKPKLQKFFFEKKTMLNIKRKVKLICSEYCESPVTIGVLSPTILFPIWDKDNMIDDELSEYMITHELVHIKHNDVLIKLIGLLVIAIHWFNPFVYLFISELSCISEMYCDSVVMDGKGEDERKKYKSLLSAIMATFICMAGGITVFAYQPPSGITNETNKVAGTDMSVMYESLLSEELLSDTFTTSEDGIAYTFCNENEDTKTSCNHDYSISVKVKDHTKNDNGGCTLDIYSALKCTKCTDIKLIELWSTTTYKSCPH